MISKESKSKYKNYVIEELAEKHDISLDAARSLVKSYKFDSLLDEYPSETLHYPVEYWADEIYQARTKHIVKQPF